MSLEEFKKEVVNRNCRRKGTIIQSKEREVIKSIIEFCDQEAKQKSLLVPLRQATKRAAHYAKVSERTVKRIREENKLGLEFGDVDNSQYTRLVRVDKLQVKAIKYQKLRNSLSTILQWQKKNLR